MKLSLVSNAGFLIPVLFAFWIELYGGGSILLLVTIFSSLYHVDENNSLHMALDMLCVTLLSVYLWALLLSIEKKFTYINVIAACFCFLALQVWFLTPSAYAEEHDGMPCCGTVITPEYDAYHTMWHVLVCFCVVALLYSYSFSNLYRSNTYLVQPIFRAF